jgi:hypothetical protein
LLRYCAKPGADGTTFLFSANSRSRTLALQVVRTCGTTGAHSCAFARTSPLLEFGIIAATRYLSQRLIKRSGDVVHLMPTEYRVHRAGTSAAHQQAGRDKISCAACCVLRIASLLQTRSIKIKQGLAATAKKIVLEHA